MNTELFSAQRPVVVGLDGSPSSLAALTWADDQARRMGAPLRVVVALHAAELDLAPGDPIIAVPPRTAEVIDLALYGALGERASEASVEYSSLEPADALLEHSRHAELLVIGAHSSAGLPGLWRGSIPEVLICRAPCAVAVVGEGVRTTTQDAVVGVDGSAHGTEALRWALDHARRVAGAIRAVTVCTATPGPIPRLGGEPPRCADAAQVLADAVAAAAPDDAEQSALDRLVVAGKPARVLVELAAESGLLVVGRRGTGLRTEHPLGSVSLACLRHADVPVVVVKTPEPLTV